MSVMNLLHPQSIAVVGANERPGSYGYFAAVNTIESQSARVYFINNKSSQVLGRKTYASLGDLPEVPECMMICTPKATVPAILEDAGRRGVKAAIIISAGYGEDGTPEGKAAENQLCQIAKKYNMKVMGPNCTGLVNNVDKIKMWSMGGTDFNLAEHPTGVACFANSGTMALHSLGIPYLGISYSFSLGNCAMLPMEELLEVVLEDASVKVIGIYLEGSRDPKRLVKCLRRAAVLGKPVVLHAAGMSAKGSASAASHTGNIASSRAVYQALAKKYGVIIVENSDEYFSALNILSTWGDDIPQKATFAALNNSGGENTVCADMCEKYGVPLPDLQKETIDRLKSLLPVFASPKNPLDVTSITTSVDELFFNVFSTFASDPQVGAIIVTNDFAVPSEKSLAIDRLFNVNMTERQAAPILRYRKSDGAIPMIVVPLMENLRDPEWRKRLADLHIPIAANSSIGFNVLGKICRYIDWKNEEHTFEDAVPEKLPGSKTRVLTESESKALLAKENFPLKKSFLAKTKEDLIRLIDCVQFPVVMKISSPDIMHKTEAGGVVLSVQSVAEAESAFDRIMLSCRTHQPDALLEGVLVEEMAEGGQEIILSISADPKYGPMLMVGLGGIYVEIFRDVNLYPCPLSKEEALQMLKGLKSYKLLCGYRGSKPADVENLAELMVKLSQFAAENVNCIKEIELNPVIVHPEGKGCDIVDALATIYES